MSMTLFLALPTPLKILAFIVGGFFFAGARNVQMEKVGALKEARAEAADVAADAAVDPPNKAAVARDKPAAVKVTGIMLNADGTFSLGKEKLNAAQLEKKLKALAESQPGALVVLRAEKQVPQAKIQAAMKLCQQAGIKNISRIRNQR